MNLSKIQPKNEKEKLSLSILKNFETLIKQIHTRPQKTLEYKLIKTRETFHVSSPISVEGTWMMGLKSLEVYNSLSNIFHEINKFEVYKDIFSEISFEKLKGELEEIVNISTISHKPLRDEIIGPRIISANKQLETGKGGLIIVTCYYWVTLDLLFEILNVILEL